MVIIDHNTIMAPSHNSVNRQTIQIAGAILLILIFTHHLLSSDAPSTSRKQRRSNGAASRLAEPGTAYRGTVWHNERTVAVDTLGETKFARCDVHTVMSEDGKSVIDDWLFLEEVPAVNVIVHTLDGNQFVVFQQRKYAIPGSTLSPVGGMVDANESPLTAAKREVLEELGLVSRRTMQTVREGLKNTSNGRRSGEPPETLEVYSKIIVENARPPILDEYGLADGSSNNDEVDDSDWVFLGRYRTAANRGGGFLYSYLLKNAVPLLPDGGTTNYRGSGDDESQDILLLSEEEVMEALSEGKFKEIKWAGTFALAMLHLKDGMPECCGKSEE